MWMAMSITRKHPFSHQARVEQKRGGVIALSQRFVLAADVRYFLLHQPTEGALQGT